MKDNAGTMESLHDEAKRKSVQFAELEKTLKSLEEAVRQKDEEIVRINDALDESKAAQKRAETAGQEAAAENQQLTKDLDNNLEQIKEFMEEVSTPFEMRELSIQE